MMTRIFIYSNDSFTKSTLLKSFVKNINSTGEGEWKNFLEWIDTVIYLWKNGSGGNLYPAVHGTYWSLPMKKFQGLYIFFHTISVNVYIGNVSWCFEPLPLQYVEHFLALTKKM